MNPLSEFASALGLSSMINYFEESTKLFQKIKENELPMRLEHGLLIGQITCVSSLPHWRMDCLHFHLKLSTTMHVAVRIWGRDIEKWRGMIVYHNIILLRTFTVTTAYSGAVSFLIECDAESKINLIKKAIPNDVQNYEALM